MRFITKILLLVSLAATFAYAQTNIPEVQHVIVVIQENRTPDNLFQEDQTLINNGAHIASQGLCLAINDRITTQVTVQLSPAPLATCWATDHNHSKSHFRGFKGAWTQMWDNGAMDGACQIFTGGVNNKLCRPAPPLCSNQAVGRYCPAMTYVQNTLWHARPPHYILDPYFQIANQYGWANYMFQTNQGPSFPAHQFLFTGTSAPIQYNGPNPCGAYPCYEWFDAENVSGNTNDQTSGCIANAGRTSYQVDPNSNESHPPNPLGFAAGYPCYDHQALSDLLDTAKVTWKYYARLAADLWTAPTAINHICMTNGGGNGGTCKGGSWQANVGSVIPVPGGDQAPFLTDITNCNLPQVSWVIPDGNWSDHSGAYPHGNGGPSWVAAIVNAIGQSTCSDTVTGTAVPYWQDTTILITWDDWGGFYDDVSPGGPAGGPGIGYSNNTGQQYVYGFRVPLLVVSAYAKKSYISGPASSPDCANGAYCHDFGSILNFVEYAFGTGGHPLGYPGGISPLYHYADYLAPDASPTCPTCTYSLSDFFNFGQIQTPTFTPITGAKYPPSCFHNPTRTGCFPTYPLDPDNDADETD